MNRPLTTPIAHRAHDLPGRDRRRVCSRSAGAVALALVLVVLGTMTASVSVAGAQAAPTVEPGEVVAAVQDTGEVVAVNDGGVVRTLVSGLNQPRAVQVLQDGSIIVAEAGANRLVGIGGRYGPTLTPIVDYPFPGGLHQALDGSIYVTSFSEGKLSVVDIGNGKVTDLATGLQTPGGLIVRNGTAYIAELNGQRIVSVDQAGRVTPIAAGFQAPLGVAGGRGAALYVADYGANEIARIENGERSVVASVPGPRGIASDPVVPRGDEPFRLVVSVETGVVEIDPDTGAVGEPAGAPGAVGVAVVRPDPAAETTTTVAGEGPATPGLGPRGDADRSQKGEPTGSPAAIVALAFVILVTVGGFLWVQLRRAHAPGGDDDYEVERLDEATLHESFGPCVTQELEAERAQSALDGVLLQAEALRRRAEEGKHEAVAARQRLADARAVRLQALAERAAVEGAEDAEPHPIHQAELDLTSDAGRVALEAYRDGAMGPVELAKRWGELGEVAAITRVREAGERARQADPTVPGPDERQAQADLAEAEADAEHARVDLTRLAARERECRAGLDTALEALTTCRSANAPIDGDDAHDPDQAAAWGEASRPLPVDAPDGGRPAVAEPGGADPTEDGTESDTADDGPSSQPGDDDAAAPGPTADGNPRVAGQGEAGVRPDLPSPPAGAVGDVDGGFLVPPPPKPPTGDEGLPTWRPPTA